MKDQGILVSDKLISKSNVSSYSGYEIHLKINELDS